jgi:hypothetical protein
MEAFCLIIVMSKIVEPRQVSSSAMEETAAYFHRLANNCSSKAAIRLYAAVS